VGLLTAVPSPRPSFHFFPIWLTLHVEFSSCNVSINPRVWPRPGHAIAAPFSLFLSRSCAFRLSPDRLTTNRANEPSFVFLFYESYVSFPLVSYFRRSCHVALSSQAYPPADSQLPTCFPPLLVVIIRVLHGAFSTLRDCGLRSISSHPS